MKSSGTTSILSKQASNKRNKQKENQTKRIIERMNVRMYGNKRLMAYMLIRRYRTGYNYGVALYSFGIFMFLLYDEK